MKLRGTLMRWWWMLLDEIEWQLSVMKEEEVMSHAAGWWWGRKSGRICGVLLDTTNIGVRVLVLRCCCYCWYAVCSGVIVA